MSTSHQLWKNWLPIQQHVTFKIATTIFKIRYLHQPTYLIDLLNHALHTYSLIVHFARHHNCFYRLILPEPSCHNVVSARQHHVSGTVYLTGYDPAVPWIFFGEHIETHLFSIAFDA